MRDISQELRQSDCPAPPQPFGRPGFGPIALLLVVGDEPASIPPRAALSGPNPGRATSRDFCHRPLGRDGYGRGFVALGTVPPRSGHGVFRMGYSRRLRHDVEERLLRGYEAIDGVTGHIRK